MTPRVVVALLLSTVYACGDVVPRTQVMVIVDAEPGVRSQTDSVEIVVRGGTGSSARWQERLDRTLTIDDQTTWPFSVALVPLKDDAARVYEFVATARSATGDAVGRVRAISGYRRGKTLELRLVFDDACRQQALSCGDAETCRDGTCADASVDVMSLDAVKPGVGSGPDASVDASVVDAPTPPECRVAGDCADQEDDDLCNGVLTCDPDGRCAVDPASVPAPCDQARDSACGQNRCQPTTGLCEIVESVGVEDCDDGNQCTTADRCEAGLCVGDDLICDDDNTCTDDSCDPLEGCVWAPLVGRSCNDESTFTDADACNQAGQCEGELIQCRSCSASVACPGGYYCASGRCLKQTSSQNPVCPPGSSARQCSICVPGVGCASGYLCAGSGCGCT